VSVKIFLFPLQHKSSVANQTAPMQLAIQHQTIYRYSSPLTYSIQQLRLTPRMELHQQTLQWKIDSSGNMHSYTDAYGNQCHTLTVMGAHQELQIQASGIVDIQSPEHGRIKDAEHLSPYIYTVTSRFTEADERITAFAHHHLASTLAGTRELLGLATAIRSTISYQSGSTIVTTSASDAIALGRGVCQDHAHVFLACCHVHGIPARYVSGYIDPESGEHADSHAWVDVWAQDTDYHGWVSIDVTHARLMTDAYCRLAIGRDYESAAPVRGVRRGGGNETMQVRVLVTPR